MQENDLITESVAASMAGVSVGTLNRFADTGYLHIQSNASGDRLFSAGEIRGVFGIENDISRYSASFQNEESLNSTVQEKAQIVEPEVNHQDEEIHQTHFHQVLPKERQNPPAPLPISSLIQELDHEITRLKNIINLQDKLIATRDTTITSLTEDKQWLKTRLERSEEKSAKDQMLLLSEAQMVRRLVSMKMPERKSKVRVALEWLGLVDAKPAAKEIVVKEEGE